MVTIEFYYDFASPAAFLGYHHLQTLVKKYKPQVIYKPVLLGAVHKATGNLSPINVPSKAKWSLSQDFPRFCKRYNLNMVFNPFFPVNCINALRGAIAIEGKGQEELYRLTVFNAMWQEKKNISDISVFKQVLIDAGFEADVIIEAISDDNIKEKLKENTTEAVNRGVFGTPTFFIGEDMYFGQDRLDFVEEVLVEDNQG